MRRNAPVPIGATIIPGRPTRRMQRSSGAWRPSRTAAAALPLLQTWLAIDSVLKLLKPGDAVLANDDLYGGTYRLFTGLYEKYGIEFHFQNMDNPEAL